MQWILNIQIPRIFTVYFFFTLLRDLSNIKNEYDNSAYNFNEVLILYSIAIFSHDSDDPVLVGVPGDGGRGGGGRRRHHVRPLPAAAPVPGMEINEL